MTDDDRVDQAIQTYRGELSNAVEIARGDLDEIEDHMRVLVGELRETGMPAVAAVAEAARRIGEPRHLALEHQRVRGSFGPRLSRARAWGAAGLLLPFFVYYSRYSVNTTGAGWLFTVLSGLLITALVARLSWARWFLFGSLVLALPSLVFDACVSEWWWWFVGMIGIAQIAAYLLAAILLAPWRRGELTSSAWVLLLMVPAFAAASWGVEWQITNDGVNHGLVMANPVAIIAVTMVLAGALGGMLRARWGAAATAIAAVSIAALPAMSDRTLRFELLPILMLVEIVLGVTAAAVATVVAWRTARSTRGTLANLVR